MYSGILITAALPAITAVALAVDVIPSNLSFRTDNAVSLRSEYVVYEDGPSAGDDWYLFLQLDKGFYQSKPIHLIQWIGLDRNWSVIDLIAVDALSYALLYRFEPGGKGMMMAQLFDPEINTFSGAQLQQGVSSPAFSRHPAGLLNYLQTFMVGVLVVRIKWRRLQ